jgi:B12-binding domain/radical SAM domain protein
MLKTRLKILFRQTPGNKFTIPLLLNLLEKENIDQKIPFEVVNSLTQFKKTAETLDRIIAVYSFMTPHLPEVWHEIRTVRTLFKDRLFLLAGGPHPTGAPEETLVMGFNTVITGAGEHIFADTIRQIIDEECSQSEIIPGSAHAALDDGLPVSNRLPFIPPLEIMRGCFYRCAFCQTGHIQKPVYRSEQSIRRYLKILLQRNFLFRTGFICPSGLEYGASKPGVIQLDRLERLLVTAKSIGIRHLEYGIFPSEIYPRTMNREALALIRKYCSNRKLTLGAQTGASGLLRQIKRGHRIEDIESAVRLSIEADFQPIIDFIIGFPGETENDRLLTLQWIRSMHSRYGTRVQMHYFIPLAGTRLYNMLPTVPGHKSREILDAFYKGGICTNWWRKGFSISWKLIRTREKLGTLTREDYENQESR